MSTRPFMKQALGELEIRLPPSPGRIGNCPQHSPWSLIASNCKWLRNRAMAISRVVRYHRTSSARVRPPDFVNLVCLFVEVS